MFSILNSFFQKYAGLGFSFRVNLWFYQKFKILRAPYYAIHRSPQILNANSQKYIEYGAHTNTHTHTHTVTIVRPKFSKIIYIVS